MSKINRQVGATSQILQVFVRDSSSTTGGGLTGLVFNSASLTAYYHRDTDTTATAISLVTMTVGTFTSSGFKEIDATNMPGWYQFCPPNAAFASGAASVGFHLKGATNMAPMPIECDLNNQADVKFWNGTAVATPATAGVPDVNVKNMNNVAATSITTINANVGTTQPVNFTGTGASALAKSDMVDIAGAAVSTSAAQIGVNVIQLNAQTVTAAAGVTFPASVASPTNITAGTITTTTNLTNAPTSGDFTATMKTSLNAATPVVTVSDKTGFSLSAAGVQAIWDALTSALTTVGSIGKLLVDNINATISSRFPTASAPSNFSALGITAGGKISGVVLTDTVTTYTGNTVQTGDSFARLGVPAGASVSADITAVQADTDNIQTRIPATLISGRIDASVGAMAANVLTSSALATSAVDEIVDQVWDEAIAGHLSAGSTGLSLNSAGSAGDPWATALPGAYGAGTAGKIVGDNLNATVSSRATPADVPTANANADALLDRSSGVEASVTPRQTLRLMLSALAGKLSGAATTTVAIRNTPDTKTRITATVDPDGNRTAVSYDVS